MIPEEMLPLSIRQSKILTTNNLQQLSTIDDIPAIDAAFTDDRLKQIIQYYSINPNDMETEIHHYAHELIENGKITEAWQVLLTTI
ncbi:hypothetical protein LK994_05565 [Ferruginibacter lapsinanis]|uniref:hypothetical protein n=1 Tax=Ferruginibacter lapsinanis TaxID=563172 RepID=UPI001E341F4E|nr:hypothetical protein [Ferruginibacter lapsinanis]UEG50940.1 hypothetical protein LK994_05565 [Ferruginibacter lapsinanis]